MKTYIADIIPKIQRFSQKLNNLTSLTNQHWVVVDEITSSKTVYIFRVNGELLIVTNGKVSKAKWEYLGNKSILIDNNSDSYLLRHGFFDENVLALKIDGKDEYAFLVNENKYEEEINSIEKVINFLNTKYLNPSVKENIPPPVTLNNNSNTNKMADQAPEVKKEQEKDFRLWTYVFIAIVVLLFIMLISNSLGYTF